LSVQRTAQTVPINVKYGEKSFNHRFEVLDIAKGVNCVFGLDVFSKAGIYIAGLETKFPDLVQEITPVVVEEKSTSSGVTRFKDQSLEEIIEMLKSFNKNHLQYSDILSEFQVRLKKGLEPLLKQNSEISGFCCLPSAVISLDTGIHAPSNVRQYRLAHAFIPIVTDQINLWLVDGIIELSPDVTSWNVPLILVPKRDAAGKIKGWRVCIDPRPINAMLASVSFPLPLIRPLFELLKGAGYFTKLDLKAGYNQFRIKEEHREKTTFTWLGKQYRFIGVPFGFKIVPGIFQRTMSKLFEEYAFVFVYMDDIIIFSVTP
jgi:hypothetical protein